METSCIPTSTFNQRYNEIFIDLLEQLSNIMSKQGEPFRARAYNNAQETIARFPCDITNVKQLEQQPNIGHTILEKLNQYVTTGKIQQIEDEKNNPVNLFAEIYGIGPKKAMALTNAGIRTLDELRQHQNSLLNSVQKVGLLYHEQIIQRIPREEILQYETRFRETFSSLGYNNTTGAFEIVGSYRRGTQTSGDIDVIITSKNRQIYEHFVDELIKQNIIVHVLSRGHEKTLVIAKLNDAPTTLGRRIDFLYTPPDEYAFATLYFTGSKYFNIVMRQEAINQGYTLNEHGIYNLVSNKKGSKIDKTFCGERDIFDFLSLVYKEPSDRNDGRSLQRKFNEKSLHDSNGSTIATETPPNQIPPVRVKNKTFKKRHPIQETRHERDISEHIRRFNKEGVGALSVLDEQQLSNMLTVANKKYFNQQSVMTDSQFDILKEFVENKYPHNTTIHAIGTEVERNKARLPYLMPSMDKIKPDTHLLDKWAEKFTGPYLVSSKLDGVSGLYTTEGNEPKLYTRGNGMVGQDISHLIPHLRLPKTKGVVIRGEFIIPKEIFDVKYKTRFANPRNMVSGVINHKTISETTRDIHFVAYEVIKPYNHISQQMLCLESMDVEVVRYAKLDKLTNERLSEILVEWRNHYEYEMDGVIVTNDQIHERNKELKNPDHAFAFKMVLSEQVAEAKVLDVIWTPSKDGLLKPRIHIESIVLGGVKIEYATGFNAGFIVSNKIGIGSVVQVIRSGDVIPYIKTVVVAADEAKMPDVPYRWNDTHIDIVIEDIETDDTVRLKNITQFFRGIEVDGLSSGNIARIIRGGYNSVDRILKMSKDDFLKIDGFKETMSIKICDGIKSSIDKADIVTLMAASNVFGRGFSDKRLELILTSIPDILTAQTPLSTKVQQVVQVKGMATKSAEQFVEKIGAFTAFLQRCDLEYKLNIERKGKQPEQLDLSHPLFGKLVVLTGSRDKEVIHVIEKYGANLTTSVSKRTDLVVAKDREVQSTSIVNATKFNVPIMDVAEFLQLYGP